MPFQAYNKLLIVKEPIQNTRVGDAVIGYTFKLQYPSYRGTFLSCIENLTFKVDDEPVDPKDVYFRLNGKQFVLDELKDCFKEYWFVMDFATIQVMKPGGLSEGDHKLEVCIRHRIPYTGYFGDYMVMDADETRVLPVQ